MRYSTVQFKDRKIYTYLIFILGLNETVDQMVMAECLLLVWSC